MFGRNWGIVAYIVINIIIIGGFISGILMFMDAKKKLCTKKDYRTVLTTKRTVTGRAVIVQEREYVCVEHKSAHKANKKTRNRYYGGIAMIVVFSILMLIFVLPEVLLLLFGVLYIIAVVAYIVLAIIFATKN